MLRKLAWLWVLIMPVTGAWADAPKAFFTLHELGKGVWAAVSLPGSHAGGNTGFVVGSDGVVVIDTFQTPEAAQALLDAIHKTTDKPIRYVVNTHYHLDHVMGNTLFAQAGATVIAQDNVRIWERSQNLKFFGDKIKPEQKQMVQTLGLPSLTYKDGVTLHLGDRDVIVRVVTGHTGGDSAVIVPDAQVVFTGDLFWNHTLPNLIDADTSQQIATDESFVKDYPDATFVAGHGEIGKADDVQAFDGYLSFLRQQVGAAQATGKSGQALEDQVLAALKPKYGTWGYYDYFAQKNVEQTATELLGRKTRPVPGQP